MRNRYFVAVILAKIAICRQFSFVELCAVGNVYADQIPRLSGMLVGEVPSNGKLMLALDTLNQRFGRGTVKVSTQGAFKDWQMRQERKSPNYTSDWDEVPIV